jgi:hypothetical protein
MDTISIRECEAFNAIPFIDDAINAIRVFDHPCIVLLTNFRMQARDALIWYLHIVS